MKKLFFSLLILLCFMQQINARAVLSGESLWALQRLVAQASCDVTIRQIDLTVDVYTISTSGVYCLAENITGKIIIDTDNVVLDLNGKTMTNASGDCVVVNGKSNALIKNGSVIAKNDNGISVLARSDQVSVKEVTSYDCITGIDVDSSTNISIHACELIASSVGVAFTSVSRAQVSDSIASDSEFTGFLLDSSSKSFFTNCHALNTGQGLTDQTANIYGFLSADGSSNIFSECIAQNTLALTVTGVTDVTVGFAFTGTESDSQITKCTSSVIETNANGFAIPYGIQLQYSFDALTTVTGGNQGIGGTAIDWSPDGAYLATGGNPEDGNEIQIFSFDRATETLTTLTVENQGSQCFSVSWSPSGDYLATAGFPEGTTDDIQIFSFDRGTVRLTKTDGQPQGALGISVSWSPDGAYLATGGFSEGPDDIQIFSFNRATGTLTKTDGASQAAACISVSWSPDGAYLATGGNPAPADEIQLFSFDRGTGTLTKTGEASQGTLCQIVSWSPDGAFLATGGARQAPTDDIQLFSFDRETETITKIDGQSQGVECRDISWSPDGVYLATVGGSQALNEFQIFKAFLFPSRNSITHNTVQSASRSSSLAAGVGISGSSIENLIIGNSSYDNGGFNYQFVTNVFDERFATIPTVAQNISIKLSPPFYAP